MSFETVLFSWWWLGKVQRVDLCFPFDNFPNFSDILNNVLASEVAAKITLLLPRGREMYARPGEALDMAWTPFVAHNCPGFPQLFPFQVHAANPGIFG
jgi:hypothetical protein